MITGAIFDVDGVLLDSIEAWEEVDTRYLQAQGITPDSDLAQVLLKMHMTESVEYMRERYRLPWTPEEILTQILEMMEEYYTHIIQPKEGALDLLQELKGNGIPVTVATAGDRGLAQAGLKSSGLLPYIDKLFTCGEVGAGKESPAVYQAAWRSMGTELSGTWVFEDSLHGVITAGRAGFPTVGVYDKASEGNMGQMRENSTYYMMDFQERDGFYALAGFPGKAAGGFGKR